MVFIIFLKQIFLGTRKFGGTKEIWEGTAPECPPVATGLSEPLNICCHVIGTQQRPIVEQCAHKFRNLPLQAKERI